MTRTTQPLPITQVGETVTVGANTVSLSDPDTTVSYTDNGQSYCIEATNTKVSNDWTYDSANGGLAVGALC